MTKFLSIPTLLLFLVTSIFAGPLVYRIITFYNALAVCNYQEFPSNPQNGDQIKTFFKIEKDYQVMLFRESHYYGRYYHRFSSIVDVVAPAEIEIHNESSISALLSTSNQKIFKEILDAQKASEVVDSFLLYRCENVNGQHVYYEIEEGLEGEWRNGRIIDAETVNQFSLMKLSESVKEQNPPSVMNYKELLRRKAPAVLYTHQNRLKEKLIFGVFEVINTNPLTVECVKFISPKPPNQLKAKIWSKWFSGFYNLLLWGVFTILFCISLFFIFQIIIRLALGKPID